MAHTPASSAGGKEFVPPPINGDFYRIADLLEPKERAVAKRVREFMEIEVAPIIEDFWGRDQFPHEIIPKLAALDVHIAGVGYEGYGAAGGSWLLNGVLAMELARIDSSIATSGASTTTSRQARSTCVATRARGRAGCHR